jgi:predicted 2-oxoglutarate/Fe(II)-dependent dioxygenase YbiX
MIEILENLLTKEELKYINDLINDKTKWEWRTTYNQKNYLGENLWFDSIFVDDTKLKEYYKIITSNGEYELIETAINIIKSNRQIHNSKHKDSGDLSFVTYLNDDFKGGNLIYYDKDLEFSIIPKIGLSVKIYSGTSHRVEPIISGVRFSLYTFLLKKQKTNKSLI